MIGIQTDLNEARNFACKLRGLSSYIYNFDEAGTDVNRTDDLYRSSISCRIFTPRYEPDPASLVVAPIDPKSQPLHNGLRSLP